MAKIPEDKIDEIRTSVNLVHYIGQFVNLKKAGKNYKGLCPFHTEKTPSFNVSPEKQIYHCFGCGKGGNIFSFIMDYEKLSFTEAVRKAADFAGIILPKPGPESQERSSYFDKLYSINESACQFFEDALRKPANKRQLKYFQDRSISEQTLKLFRLGYAPDGFEHLLRYLRKNNVDLVEAAKLGLIQKREGRESYYDKFRHRVIFPFQNVSGKIIGFGGRQLRKEDPPKYLNSPESPLYKKGELLYGLHQAITPIREKQFVVVVEGYFDLLRLVENQFKNVVASSGTAMTEQQARLIRRYTKEVYIAYDGDEAGIKAAIRNAQILEKQDLNVYIAPLPAGDDPDTFVLENGLKAFEEILKDRKTPLEFRIATFFSGHQNPALEAKNQFIQDMLNDLAELKDKVKVSFYLHQIAERFQINENLLIEQLNHIRYFRRKQIAPDEVEESQTKPLQLIFSGVPKAEAGIVSLLLSGAKTVRDYILHHVSYELFENEIFIRIYEEAIQELEETGELDSGRIMLRFQDDQAVEQVLSELALSEYEDAMRYARDCIFQLQKYQLEKKSRELQTMIKEDHNSPEAVLHYTQELLQIRRELNQLEKAHKQSIDADGFSG